MKYRAGDLLADLLVEQTLALLTTDGYIDDETTKNKCRFAERELVDFVPSTLPGLTAFQITHFSSTTSESIHACKSGR